MKKIKFKVEIEYDEEVDAAYISLGSKKDEGIDSLPVTDSIIVDLYNSGRMLGIEVLNAREHLPKSILDKLKVDI